MGNVIHGLTRTRSLAICTNSKANSWNFVTFAYSKVYSEALHLRRVYSQMSNAFTYYEHE